MEQLSKMIKRFFVVVLDGLGVGALPDAGDYGDEGSNTLSNLSRAVGGLNLPCLKKLGLGNIVAVEGMLPVLSPWAAYGKMAEKSAGKDTTTGHWELMGIVLERPFPTFPHGFPPELIKEFERRIGRRTLGNVVASGTQIIEELGPLHQQTGWPIIYTSADSVFQIAAHEEVIAVKELYAMCEVARELLQGPYAVGRVIARPFVGEPGRYRRTERRHDYSLPPPAPTLLDKILESGREVRGVGKIKDIFAGRGISASYPTGSNREGMQRLQALVTDRAWEGMAMANLVDFDTLWGHRNDCAGYAEGLREFDTWLEGFLPLLGEGDVLVITADHGCDPTTSSTDHSREYVPILFYGSTIREGVNLGVRESFADLAATIASVWGLPLPATGESMAAVLWPEFV